MNPHYRPYVCGQAAILALTIHAHGATVTLGLAEGFGALAASTVTNTGPTAINGKVGVSTGTAITGFPPGTATAFHSNDSVAATAKADAAAAYGQLAALTNPVVLTGSNLGGMVLTPGVYFFSSIADITGVLTLNGNNQVDPSFVFQIGTSLTTASLNSSIITIGGADPSQVYFRVGSSATIGTGSSMIGTIIAGESVSLANGASLRGRAIALNGAVTLDSNLIIIPEPTSSILLISGMACLLTRRNRQGSHKAD